jgi:GNAT superfamily N-acetyltransferase
MADAAELVRLGEPDMGAAGRTLARAFHEYPVFSYVFPDAAQRSEQLPLLLQSFAHHGLLNGEVYATSAEMEGAAVWMPPHETLVASPPAVIDEEAMARMALFARGVTEVRKRHITAPHWFLMIIGVVPEHRGKSLASALLNPLLAKIDEAGLPCYLDTELVRNLTLYQRFGFHVVEEGVIEGTGVYSWGMLRDAAG